MATAITEGISKMEKTLAKENVPPGVAIAFVERVRKVTGTLTDKRRLQCSEAKTAGDLQDRLGPEAILRGHHHTAWVEAISRTYRKRVYPPGTDPEHKRKDKTALELSAVLVRECWTLFGLAWKVRNDILYSKDRYNADTMLQCGGRYQIDYPRAEILSWTRARKSGLLHLLKWWHRQYLAETMMENRDQRPLTTFGFTARHTAGDQQDLNDPSTGDGFT